MITITVSTTGIAPNAAGNPAEAHAVSDVEHRRFFEPSAEVVTLTLTRWQAIALLDDIRAQIDYADEAQTDPNTGRPRGKYRVGGTHHA